MALTIGQDCIACWACEPVCPNGAIKVNKNEFRIDALLCNHCEGYEEFPQCAEICPVEGAIVDAVGIPLNPPGSLTGIHKTINSNHIDG